MFINRLADNRKSTSLAGRYRKKRFEFFQTLLSKIEKPINILDIGGTFQYWNLMGGNFDNIHLTILNLECGDSMSNDIAYISGDARQMKFGDQSFDIVFSNSVIEHVGDFSDQMKMATEVRRVGKRYFLQTPNRSFPIEPHYIFPFFQFFPLKWQKWLIMHFNLGWMPRQTTEEGALEMINSIRLLNKQELISLFPGGKLFEEKILGLTKSFVIYSGWD